MLTDLFSHLIRDLSAQVPNYIPFILRFVDSKPEMPSQEADWSDSDQEELSDVETSVLLGVPDGPIDIEKDLIDAAVSRIGGFPAFLPSPEPPFSSSLCESCNKPMELLVQMWCPFENSPMDRALYIWGCARVGCQNQNGSVRAWRGLRWNKKYAAKLERTRMRESPKVKDDAEKMTTTNPFAASLSHMGAGTFLNVAFQTGNTATADTHTYNMGAQIFGHVSTEVEMNSAVHENEVMEDKDGANDIQSDSLITALASVTVAESPWGSAPSYPALYLSTVGEYLPPQTKLKGIPVPEMGDETWATETYENSLEMDHVFERFAKRVGYEGKQCVRYELRGRPLPFASDKTFGLLWRQDPVGRVYDASSVPRCSGCGSERVFECQLMPNLINVLRAGMEWGTCLVYCCGKDCSTDDWREEVVYVQWDV